MSNNARDTLIAGWYGMHNTGDDALFAVAGWGARNRLLAGHLAATAQSLPVLPDGLDVLAIQSPTQRFKGQNRLRRYLHAWRAHRVLFGGGSVFQTAADIRDKITMMKLAGADGHRAVGVSLGPFADAAAERACAEALKRLDFAGLRDADSHAIARSLAPDTPSAQTFDLAPLLYDAFGDAPPGDGAPRPPSGRLGLALCPFESVYRGDPLTERRRLTRIADALLRLDRDAVNELVLIDFNGHPHFGDAATHDALCALIGDALPVRRVAYAPDPRVALREIAALDAVVAMRLHAAVYGFLAATPTVVLAYHPKCRGWAGQIGLPGAQTLDSADFEPAVLTALLRHGLAGTLGAPTLTFADARERALQNWRDAA